MPAPSSPRRTAAGQPAPRRPAHQGTCSRSTASPLRLPGGTRTCAGGRRPGCPARPRPSHRRRPRCLSAGSPSPSSGRPRTPGVSALSRSRSWQHATACPHGRASWQPVQALASPAHPRLAVSCLVRDAAVGAPAVALAGLAAVVLLDAAAGAEVAVTLDVLAVCPADAVAAAFAAVLLAPAAFSALIWACAAMIFLISACACVRLDFAVASSDAFCAATPVSFFGAALAAGLGLGLAAGALAFAGAALAFAAGLAGGGLPCAAPNCPPADDPAGTRGGKVPPPCWPAGAAAAASSSATPSHPRRGAAARSITAPSSSHVFACPCIAFALACFSSSPASAAPAAARTSGWTCPPPPAHFRIAPRAMAYALPGGMPRLRISALTICCRYGSWPMPFTSYSPGPPGLPLGAGVASSWAVRADRSTTKPASSSQVRANCLLPFGCGPTGSATAGSAPPLFVLSGAFSARSPPGCRCVGFCASAPGPYPAFGSAWGSVGPDS